MSVRPSERLSVCLRMRSYAFHNCNYVLLHPSQFVRLQCTTSDHMRTTVALHYNCTFYRAFHLSQTASHSSEPHFSKHLPITVTSSEFSCLLCPKSLLRKTKILIFCYALYLLLATSYCYCTSTPCEMRGPNNARWSRPSAIFPPPSISQNVDSTATPISAWRH